MRNLACFALVIGAGALFAGCGGSQPPISAPEAISPTRPDAGDLSHQRLFVTEYTNSTVLVYDATAKSPSPKRRITIGVDDPTGACVDGNGTLYVVNTAGWIAEYPAGRTRPTKIIKDGIGEPQFCAIDGAGNLWVTDSDVFRFKRRSGPSLSEYKPHARKPATIIMKGLTNPFGIAIDQSGNIYVANRSFSYGGNVVVYAPGKKSPSRTITDGVTSPVGIAIDANDTLYVANIFQNTVAEYKSGTSDPYQMITQGLDYPASMSASMSKAGSMSTTPATVRSRNSHRAS